VVEPANNFALRYELSKRLYLEAASGLASSLDLFYRRDF
jgi:translocation and assembly module TamB